MKIPPETNISEHVRNLSLDPWVTPIPVPADPLRISLKSPSLLLPTLFKDGVQFLKQIDSLPLPYFGPVPVPGYIHIPRLEMNQRRTKLETYNRIIQIE